MKISNINIQNIKLNNLSFAHQNPINFKGGEQKDSFTPSIKANAKREIKFLEDSIQYLETQNEESKKKLEQIERDIKTLQALISSPFSQDEINDVIYFSNSPKKDKLKNLLAEIFKTKFGENALSKEGLNELSTILRKAFYRMSIPRRSSEYVNSLITEAIYKAIDNLFDKCDRIKAGIDYNKSLINEHSKQIEDLKFNPALYILNPCTFTYTNPTEQHAEAKANGAFIYLNDKEYDNISAKAKVLIRHHLDTQAFFSRDYLIRNKKNQDFLDELLGFDVISREEYNLALYKQYAFSSFEHKKLDFPNKVFDKNNLVLLPKGSPIKKLIEDIESEKIRPISDIHNLGVEADSLPFTYKKYSDDDSFSEIDYAFIDLGNEGNKKILNSTTKYRYYLSQMPFSRIKAGYNREIVDMDNEENKKLLEQAKPLYPQKSKYYFESLGSRSPIKIDVPVEYLESLGFSKTSLLIDLINNGKLDGKKDESGQFYVTIDTKNRLGKNKNLDVLYLLRKQNPKIKSFKEVAKALEIKQERLEYAIFSGEVELIKEYINPADREIRFIDITTPKNQEFIRKVKFEQELEKQIKESQREARKQAKIEQKDLTSRLKGIRMALVWEFMPNTKAIGSMLAKKDGYVAKLLAKEDDPNETLTNLEEAKINSYKKEIWMLAGTDELKEAYKKAGNIMKTFKEQGLSAIDEEYLPIFERYGFTK